MSRRQAGSLWAVASVLAASGASGGCNLLIGLDDVNIVQTGGATEGTSDATSASGGGGGSSSASGGPGGTGAGGTATSSSSGQGGGMCTQDGDCTPPLVCAVALGTCVPPSCDDDKIDGDETGPDCGGSVCPPCGDGLGCEGPSDCVSGVCSGTCQAATCADSAENGDETDVDCGGSCPGKCGSSQGCSSDGDCESQICAGNGEQKLCAAPACDDGVVNGGEQCDDGNPTSNDGCSSACNVEAGYGCTGTPSVCAPVCGDATVKGDEECDDGNQGGGDGCSSWCNVEPLYQCTSWGPSTCTKQETFCFDGVDNDGDSWIDVEDADCVLPAYFPALQCGTIAVYRSVNVPKNIPDSSGSAWDPIEVPQEVSITHVALMLDITHPRLSDLDVTLFPPSGTPRNLTTGNGDDGDDYGQTVFDSSCAVNVTAGAAPFDDCYKPEQSLPSSGQANGAWFLRVSDKNSGQTGTLDGWALVLCTE